MRNLIHRAAHRLGLLFAPGTGTHRAGPRPIHRSPVPRCTAPAMTRHLAPPPLPPHRSPYGLGLALDGAESALVRPYLTVRDQDRPRRRRAALVPAADFGIEPDRRLIGVGEAAA
ncbi:hypothetical protein [Streptomyces sp. NPDC007264]|uniref:hypothetical protein n=1 Tax=Streptomyces sp. NPDC007264 TaxID=3364777 RepID=UPI0036D760AD